MVYFWCSFSPLSLAFSLRQFLKSVASVRAFGRDTGRNSVGGAAIKEEGGKEKVRTCALALLTVLLCLSPSLADQVNWFDGGQRTYGIVRGVKGTITTSPPPLLHGGQFSCAWVMICTATGPERFAQAGYMRRTGHTGLEIFVCITDAEGNYDANYKWFSAPGGGDHIYECLQNASTKVWTVKYDGGFLYRSVGNTAWDGDTCEFEGEVAPTRAVQMVGDSEHPVMFSQLYRWSPVCGSQWQDAYPTHWLNEGVDYGWHLDLDVTNGKFWIWDETP